MKRIRRRPDEALAPLCFEPPVTKDGFLPSEHRSVPCSFFAPHHYEPNYEYPLLIWLHGPGDDERQLYRVLPHISLRNYVAIGPRGTSAGEPGVAGYRWRQDAAAIESAEQQVLESVALACKRYRVDTERIFLGGYQCGGTMALRIGLRHPRNFAGAFSLGGRFPRRLAPLAAWPEIRQLPLLIAQSRDSRAYPVRAACRELSLFHAASLKVALRQYPCGDELTTQMLRDLNVWLLEGYRGGSSEAASPPAHEVFQGEQN